jgi:Protein of unknown function (DUF3619)
MNNPQHFGKRIKESLDQGLHVSASVEARLRSARALALDRQRQQEPALAAIMAGRGALGMGMGAGGSVPWLVRVGLPVAIIAAAFTGFNAYRDYQDRLAADDEISQRAAEMEEIDAKVLTSDLPMKALLDEDFQAWLKKPAQPSQD